MSQMINTGPCGYSLPQIVAQSDTLGRQAAAFGLSDAEQVHRLLAIVGAKLTKEFSLPEFPACLPTYRQYVTRAKADILDRFDIMDLLHCCVGQGGLGKPPSSGKEVKLDDATSFFTTAFYHVWVELDVPPSDFLDLLAWIQCVLGLRRVCAEDPALAALVGLMSGSGTDAA